MKKLFIIIISLFVAFCPCLTTCNFSFAADNPSSGGGAWTNISTKDDIVAAFKAYCNTRNFKLVHEPDIYKAIIAYDYDQLEKVCALLDIDLESLNAHIWYMYNKNGFLKFWIDKNGINTFNAIYASLLEAYNMNGQEQFKNVYQNEWFEDADGNSCFIFDVKSGNLNNEYNASQYASNLTSGNLTQGSIYRYSGAEIFTSTINGEITSYITRLNDGTNVIFYLGTINSGNDRNNRVMLSDNNTLSSSDYRAIYINTYNYIFKNGFLTIVKYNNQYYIGSYCNCYRPYYQTDYFYICAVVPFNAETEDFSVDANQTNISQTITDKSLTITTNDNSIQNYITNNDSHDTYNYGDEDEPEEDPKQKPVPPDSVTPNPNNPSLPTGDPDFNFQMPNINIDWNLDLDPDNLPFPFSIPNDIYHAFDSLNVEAEAPHFEGTVDLYVCDWEIDIDFEQFASLANIFNKWFLFVYVVGLIIATRSLMHIY